MLQIHPWYDGKEQRGSSKDTFYSRNPATSEPVAEIHTASEDDIDAAILSASNAFPSWSATPPVARARILLKAVQILHAHNDELAKTETIDTGKPFSETSAVDVVTGADVLEYFAGLISGGGLNGETAQLREDAWVYTRKEPLGVCAGIGAWNYPIQISLWKSAPCLAAGNTMVYKPSEFTPIHATRLAAIYKEAGLPPGVFNVVHGAGEVGQYLTAHPGIAKVSFTGQVSTGQKVASSASYGMKYVTMELGGKSPLLVLPDADVDAAVDGAMMANFFSTGQVCTNGTRVFIPEEMKGDFENVLLDKMRHIRMGHPMDQNTNFGPLVSDAHLKKVKGYIQHGINIDKATVLYDGKAQVEAFQKSDAYATLKNGYWCPPYIFTNCRDDMKIVQEEIFGPAMAILTYPTSNSTASSDTSSEWPAYLDELLARANATPLGLAAGVFTRNIALGHKVAARLQAGILWVNTWGESPAEMSVGGWKMSGVGVENGRRGIEAWVRNKSTLVEMGGKVPTAFEPLPENAQNGSEPRL